MPCELEAIQDAACASGFGKVQDSTKLLQLIAQNAADWVTALSPGTDVSIEAITIRSCESGFGMEQDSVKLQQYWAQNICDTIT